MKRTLFVFATILFFALSLSACKKDGVNNNSNNNNSNTENPGGGGGTDDGYVDLGLPSGTKWKSTNETGGINGFYTYNEAISAFGDKLPTREQFDELIISCVWEWQISGAHGYKLTGSNGNSIVLPAAGFRDCNGNVGCEGILGNYWSSTSYGSEWASFLAFDTNEKLTDSDGPCLGMSVRLVQK